MTAPRRPESAVAPATTDTTVTSEAPRSTIEVRPVEPDVGGTDMSVLLPVAALVATLIVVALVTFVSRPRRRRHMP